MHNLQVNMSQSLLSRYYPAQANPPSSVKRLTEKTHVQLYWTALLVVPSSHLL